LLGRPYGAIARPRPIKDLSSLDAYHVHPDLMNETIARLVSRLKADDKGQPKAAEIRATGERMRGNPGRQFVVRGKNNIGWAIGHLSDLHYVAKNASVQLPSGDIDFDLIEKLKTVDRYLPRTPINIHQEPLRALAAGETPNWYAGTIETSLIYGPKAGLDADPIDRVRLEHELAATSSVVKWWKGYQRQTVKVDLIGYVEDGEPVLLINATASPGVP
jgi:hypothetical protein